MKREVRRQVYHRLGRVLEEDICTDGFWEMLEELKLTELECKEVKDFVNALAGKFLDKAGGENEDKHL